MFTTESQPVIVRKLSLTLVDNEDGDLDRMCDTTYRIPLLSFDTASAIAGVPVAKVCFDREQRPYWHINDVQFAPPKDTFTVTVKSAADMPDPLLVLPLTTIQKIRVWRRVPDKRDLALEFVIRHEVGKTDVRGLADLLTVWEIGRVVITCVGIQLRLISEEPPTHERRH
jgi:hypothetical protein